MDDPVRLVCFRQASHGQVLVDYLCAQQLPCELIQEAQQFCVMLQHEADLAKAQAILNHYLDAPHDPRYQAASWDSGKVRSFRSGSVTVPPGWFGEALNTPLVTSVLVLCSVIFMLMPLRDAGMWIYSHLFIAPLNELVVTHEWWRLLTPAFIHFSFMHIAFNLLWWWILGQQIELRMGRSTLLLLLVSIGVISNVGQLMVSGPNFGGLSGVVYGLLGFYWILGWFRPHWGFVLNKGVIGFMLAWLALGYVDILPVNMANTAHTLGLLTGMIWAVVFAQLGKR